MLAQSSRVRTLRAWYIVCECRFQLPSAQKRIPILPRRASVLGSETGSGRFTYDSWLALLDTFDNGL